MKCSHSKITPTASNCLNSNREVIEQSHLEELGFEEAFLLNVSANVAPEVKTVMPSWIAIKRWLGSAMSAGLAGADPSNFRRTRRS